MKNKKIGLSLLLSCLCLLFIINVSVLAEEDVVVNLQIDNPIMTVNGVNTEIDEGTYAEPSKMKLAVWLDQWLRDYIGNVKGSTVKSYQDHVRINIKPYIGEVPLSKLTTAMVQNMYNELLREKGLSPKTIKNVHGVLHRALDQAMMMTLSQEITSR